MLLFSKGVNSELVDMIWEIVVGCPGSASVTTWVLAVEDAGVSIPGTKFWQPVISNRKRNPITAQFIKSWCFGKAPPVNLWIIYGSLGISAEGVPDQGVMTLKSGTSSAEIPIDPY